MLVAASRLRLRQSELAVNHRQGALAAPAKIEFLVTVLRGEEMGPEFDGLRKPTAGR